MDYKNIDTRIESIMRKIISDNEMIKVERYDGSFTGVMINLTSIRNNQYARNELAITASTIKVISEETLKGMLNTFVHQFREETS